MDDKSKSQLIRGLIALGLLIAFIYYQNDSKAIFNLLQNVMTVLLPMLVVPLAMLLFRNSGHKTFWDDIENIHEKPFQHDPELKSEFDSIYMSFKNNVSKAAIKRFNKLLEKCVSGIDRGIVSYFIAVCHHILKDYDSAIYHYKTAIRLHPDIDMAWANLGSLYRKNGNYSEAAECLKKALEINDKNPLAHNNMANLCIIQRDTDRAIFHANKALEIAKNMYQSTQVLAVAYAIKGQMPEAKEYYKKSKKQRKKSSPIIKRMLDDAFAKDKINMKKLYKIYEYPSMNLPG